MVCIRRDRADELQPGLARQDHSDCRKAGSGNEQEAARQGTIRNIPCPLMAAGSCGDYEGLGFRTMSRRRQTAMVSKLVRAMTRITSEPLSTLSSFEWLNTFSTITRYQRPTPMPDTNSQRGDPGPQMPIFQPTRYGRISKPHHIECPDLPPMPPVAESIHIAPTPMAIRRKSVTR